MSVGCVGVAGLSVVWSLFVEGQAPPPSYARRPSARRRSGHKEAPPRGTSCAICRRRRSVAHHTAREARFSSSSRRPPNQAPTCCGVCPRFRRLNRMPSTKSRRVDRMWDGHMRVNCGRVRSLLLGAEEPRPRGKGGRCFRRRAVCVDPSGRRSLSASSVGESPVLARRALVLNTTRAFWSIDRCLGVWFVFPAPSFASVRVGC